MSALPPHAYPQAAGLAMALSALVGIFALTGHGGPGGAGLAGWWAVMAGTVALAALNLLFTAQTLASLRTIAWLTAGAFVFAAARSLGPGQRAACLLVLAAAGTGMALHGLWQVGFGFERLAQAAADEGGSEALRARIASHRAVATIGLPGALAGFLSLTLCATGSWMTSQRTSTRWWLGAGLAGVQVAGLIATRSAAGIVALSAALSTVVLVSARRDAAFDRPPRGRPWVFAALLIVAGLGLATAMLWQRLSPAGAAAGEASGPIVLRAGNWIAAGRMFAAHPMAGVGLGCFGTAFPGFRTWEMNESRHAHNSYLQAFAEGGILVGLASLLAAIGLVWIILSRARAAAVKDRPGAFLTAAAPLAFLAHNLVDFTIYLPTVALTFFLLAGFGAGRRAAARRPGAAGAALVVIGAMGLALFALVIARADVQVAVAGEALAAGDLPLAESAARKAIAWDRIDPKARSFLSHLLLDRASSSGVGGASPEWLEEAEWQATKAAQLDPLTAHHWQQLGRTRAARGDLLGAYVALSRAVDLHPVRLEYREERDALKEQLDGSRRGSRQSP